MLEIDEACAAIQQAGEALQASCMVPNLPARAEQAAQFISQMGPGISELRSSQGTRAWLISGQDSESSTAAAQTFLVADCNRALAELQSKLHCRGLPTAQILVLDEQHKPDDLPPGWNIFSTLSGTSLFYKPTQQAGPSGTLFCPDAICLKELQENENIWLNLSADNLLVCLAAEATPLTAYDVFSSTQSAVQTTVAKPMSGQIECTKQELMQLLVHERFMVLDVREPFEAATSHLDEILFRILGSRGSKKLSQERISHVDFHVVPLSRLPQFLLDCMKSISPERILCVCRSGQRSLQAAQLLRRTVKREAFSLKGGLAELLAPPVSLTPSKSSSGPHVP